MVKKSACIAGYMGGEDPLEMGMTTHSSILAWEIPWTEEPDGLQSMELQRFGHDLVVRYTYSHTHTHTHIIQCKMSVIKDIGYRGVRTLYCVCIFPVNLKLF